MCKQQEKTETSICKVYKPTVYAPWQAFFFVTSSCVLHCETLLLVQEDKFNLNFDTSDPVSII